MGGFSTGGLSVVGVFGSGDGAGAAVKTPVLSYVIALEGLAPEVVKISVESPSYIRRIH